MAAVEPVFRKRLTEIGRKPFVSDKFYIVARILAKKNQVSAKTFSEQLPEGDACEDVLNKSKERNGEEEFYGRTTRLAILRQMLWHLLQR
jgi:hypothetical protein